MTSSLYWRELTRNGTPDIDHVADPAFLSANFVDWFGKWLQDGNNASLYTLDELITVFWNGSEKDTPDYEFHLFMVADGSFVDAETKPKESWFNPHARLMAIIHTAGENKSAFSTKQDEFTLCIVGSSDLHSNERFLQVASWNGLCFRYYQREFFDEPDRNYWNYLGASTEAFGPKAYLGPFNGHVNGACIMKELHDPWIHWFNISSPTSFAVCLSEKEIEDFKAVPYITQPGHDVLSQLTEGPDNLEPMIKTGISNWFNRRQKTDFFDEKSALLPSPANIPRWTAHLFLTTTINLAATKMNPDGETMDIPLFHFYDYELLQSDLSPLLGDVDPLDATVHSHDYQTAVDKIGLSMLQELRQKPVDPKPPGYRELPFSALGSDKRDREPGQDDIPFMVILENNEGQAPFNVLQASLEDTQGVTKMQQLKKKGPGKFLGLFSISTFNAIMMLDFWNPVYSWKRGVLMQYVPQQTTWNGTAYDLEARFIQNVKNSNYVQAHMKDSPEYQFLQLLDVDLAAHQKNITSYFKAVQARLSGKETAVQALVDYLSLAEARRRIYRPLPLDEFGSSMPYALNIPYDNPPLEMKPDGTIQVMAARGQDFLQKWTQSLAGTDPSIIPPPDSAGPVSIAVLPRPSVLSLPCQGGLRSSTTGGVLAARGCPYANGPRPETAICPVNSKSLGVWAAKAKSAPYPTWNDNVLPLITKPYWISEDKRSSKSQGWIKAMKNYGGWDLSKYDDVVKRAVSIYRHLRSKAMPVTSDPDDYWPEEALEVLRNWANAGYPLDSTSAPAPATVIPKPVDPPPTYRIRRDIMSLSKEELAVYQWKLESVLQVAELGSKWQELGHLHAEWCLHYQEATFLWHRAYLRYVEELIDFPIPYWNGFSIDSATADSPFAGVPRAFFEETYKSPSGEERPNPLRFALAMDGKSKDKTSRFVTRDPVLVEGKTSPKWADKIALFKLYHQQIQHALSQSTFTSSDTAEHFGIPWQNIIEFGQDNPDSWYPFRFDFDGLFEQVHDNFHGWVGPDMADNSYTAFDPIFLSYHANMDRLAGIFMDAHPQNQFTSGFPLQPFVDNGRGLSYDDPRRWVYTTIGDMAKDTRALGYMFAPPLSPDVYTPPASAAHGRPEAVGGKAISLPAEDAVGSNSLEKKKKVPFIVFSGVGCTDKSYRIDVFAPDAESLVADPVGNRGFIGQITRLGMGPAAGRAGSVSTRECRKAEVTRVLSAQGWEGSLKGGGEVKVVVTELESGRVLGEEEVGGLPGFVGRVVWLGV